VPSAEDSDDAGLALLEDLLNLPLAVVEAVLAVV
jgi:hypothetical protein